MIDTTPRSCSGAQQTAIKSTPNIYECNWETTSCLWQAVTRQQERESRSIADRIAKFYHRNDTCHHDASLRLQSMTHRLPHVFIYRGNAQKVHQLKIEQTSVRLSSAA